jgi:hypothetical protein
MTLSCQDGKLPLVFPSGIANMLPTEKKEYSLSIYAGISRTSGAKRRAGRGARSPQPKQRQPADREAVAPVKNTDVPRPADRVAFPSTPNFSGLAMADTGARGSQPQTQHLPATQPALVYESKTNAIKME